MEASVDTVVASADAAVAWAGNFVEGYFADMVPVD